MGDSNKKRSNSFRKLFPSVFFSNKSKNKNQKQSHAKNVSGELLKSNQIARPSGLPDKEIHTTELRNERIYENVTAHHTQKYETDFIYRDISSNHSSSSTLVSESAKYPTNPSSWKYAIDQNELYHTARPQVPPKPINEVVHTQLNHNESADSQYPDVYYHSLEHLANKVSPVEEIEICKASQDLKNPTSVGAEIKRVSTTFLISPKKEAEVRIIQPKRARSLSFNNELPELSKFSVISYKNELNINKPYIYSAPTSPMPVSHKIPNMPKTVSPYEHVRKIMTETEEKRNSLNRLSNHNTSPPSPRIDGNHVLRIQGETSSPIKEYRLAEKEKTRQKVEVFYWQKLKELKEKEEEYFLKQSMNNTFLSSPDRYTSLRTHSSCSSPSSLAGEHKSHSLPRGKSLNTYTVNQTVQSNSPFVRGAPERRTDTYLHRGNLDSYSGDPGIVYRHPEKLFIRAISPGPTINMQQQSIFRENRTDNQNVSLQPKRVSFEEQFPAKSYQHTIDVVNRDVRKSVSTNTRNAYHDVFRQGNGSKESQKIPPQPPVRSSSARGNVPIVTQKKSVNSIGGSRSIYSESESGSEAGEIQRILQNNAQKGEYFLFIKSNKSLNLFLLTL